MTLYMENEELLEKLSNKFKIDFIVGKKNKITIAKDEIRLKIIDNNESYIDKIKEIANTICSQIKYEDITLRGYFYLNSTSVRLFINGKKKKIYITTIDI